MLPPPACFVCEINPNWVCDFARPRKSITAVGAFAMRGEGRRENDRYIIRWCFAEPAMAEAFAKEFGA